MGSHASTPRDRARRLRHDQTEAERQLWARLRDRQLYNAKFRRQHPVGPFITDFCCPQHRLVVELDGGQHAVQADADQVRTAFLNQHGYRVLRYRDHEVMQDIEAVLQQIAAVLQDPHPSPLLRHCVGAARFALPWPGRGRRGALALGGERKNSSLRP
jgi:very-short-patch-repair endonuclease